MTEIKYDAEVGAKKLGELLNEKDPNYKITTVSHFHFAVSELFKGERIIFIPGSDYNELPHLHAERIVQRKIQKKEIKTTQDRTEAFQVLASEYKIHLMPKPEYLLGVTAVFLDLCFKKPALLEHIYAFKIRTDPVDQASCHGAHKNHIAPQMVIYLKLGKQSADLVLKELYEEFAKYDVAKIGLGIPARYSLAINQLISYSQGGGDVKNVMTESQKDDFLSQSEVHYNLFDQHLKNPAAPDLENYAGILEQVAKVTPLKFKDIQVKSVDSQNILPYVHVCWEAPVDSQNPQKIAPEYNENLSKFINVMKQFGLRGKVLEPKEIIQANGGQFFKIRIAFYLPGYVRCVRRGFKEFIRACQKAFVEPNVMNSNELDAMDCKEASEYSPPSENAHENTHENTQAGESKLGREKSTHLKETKVEDSKGMLHGFMSKLKSKNSELKVECESGRSKICKSKMVERKMSEPKIGKSGMGKQEMDKTQKEKTSHEKRKCPSEDIQQPMQTEDKEKQELSEKGNPARKRRKAV